MQLKFSLLLLGLFLEGASATAASIAYGTPQPAIQAVRIELAGNPLGDLPAEYPHFEFVQSFNQGSEVWIAIDPFLHPQVVGVPVEVYVVASRSPEAWIGNPTLLDVAGGPIAITFSGLSIQTNKLLIDAGTLSGQGGLGIGIPYDVVVDVDLDGELSDGDLIDGLTERGFHVVQDLTLPGPLAVSEHMHDPPMMYRDQMIYYPMEVATMGALPLVVVSHGNLHNYQWYGHIGRHLASYGFIVMSHWNDTMPGIEAASQTTLDNTDYLIANQGTILPILVGHIDSHRITWIGHSRGGEGIVRALVRLRDPDDPNPASYSTYDAEDIQLLSSLAPTSFPALAPLSVPDPGDVTYSLWTGASDADINNCAKNEGAQPFHLHDRADQTRLSIAIYGAGHDDFHDGNYKPVARGPCLIGRIATHAIMKGYLLSLVKYFIEGEIGARDYLWRQWESFRPIGAPTVTCSDPPYGGYEPVVVNLQFRPGSDEGTRVLDDFQSEVDLGVSSSGGSVWWSNVQERVEDRLNDTNSNFWQIDPCNGEEPMNGMNFGGDDDDSAGVGFSFSETATLVFEVPAAERDLSAYRYLSFRAAQGSRHPNTVPPDPWAIGTPPRWQGFGELGDLTFTVRLQSGSSHTSEIRVEVYGGGLEEPYQRERCDVAPPCPYQKDPLPGWATEFETIRIRLADFRHNASDMDLTDVTSIDFLFGPAYGSSVGRVFLDDIQFEVK